MVKKVLAWLAVAFVVFYLLSQPREAAAAVRTAGNGLATAAERLATFFSSLT